MSSSPGPRFEISTTAAPNANTLNNTNNISNNNHSNIHTSTTPSLLSPLRITRPNSSHKSINSAIRGANDDVSETETILIGGPNNEEPSNHKEFFKNGHSNRRKKSTDNRAEPRERTRWTREVRESENSHKRRKRNTGTEDCRPHIQSRGKGEGDDGENTDFSSDLSSARSSRHVSPRRRLQRGAERGRSYKNLNLDHKIPTRKRKAHKDGLGLSEDENTETRSRFRRRRTSMLEASPLKQLSRSSPSYYSPQSRLSPSRASSAKNLHAEHKKQRKIPPSLVTSRDNKSSDDDYSTSGSPPRHRRIHSAARTPGSPVSMSHKPKRDTAGRTHLHRACGRGVVADVESILEQSNELINVEDNAGYVPIHEASLHGHLEVVKVLVKYGAAYDVQSSIDLESPLLDAVENGHVPVVKYLLSLGADPRKRDKQGRSCLDANKEGSESPEIRDEIESLLKTAISKQRAQRPSDDENNRASVPADRDSHSSRDDSVASPVRQTPPAQNSLPSQNIRRRNARAEQSRKDLLWLDSGKGSVIKLREKAREGDLQMVHALLETGLKPDTEALVGAIKGGHTELVSLLLAYEAEVDPVPGQSDRDGRRKRDVSMSVGEETPMLAAIGRGNVTILRYLLENGVDPRRLDSRGRSYPDIAREREGEYWQEEVNLLRGAWQKAGGHAAETKSPLCRKTSPKAKSSFNQMRRNSSSSRTQSRPPAVRIKDENSSTWSTSANSASHRLDDHLVVSDRETSMECSSKNRTNNARRTESDTLNPGFTKKRRRLVSGKVRDAEAARNDPMRSVPETGFEEKKISRQLDNQLFPSSLEDTIRVEQNSKRLKVEPSNNVIIETSPPPERPKPAVKRERSTVRSNSGQRDSKIRNRSPRAPRSDIEKEQLRKRRREDCQDDRYSPWRDSHGENDSRRLREARHPDGSRRRSMSSESSRRRENTLRSTKEDVEKSRQFDDDRRRRIKDREMEREKEQIKEREKENVKEDNVRGVRGRKEKAHKEERVREAKDPKEKEKRTVGQTEENVQKQIQEEDRELMRKKHLTRELISIQKKAFKDAAERRADEAITRELDWRRLREEEERKQRVLRERDGRDLQERKTWEIAEKENKEKEMKAKEQEERTRLREMENQEMERREKEIQERQQRERAEQEKVEREAGELEERTKREKRLHEEQCQEAERREEEENARRRKAEEEQLKVQTEIAECLKKEEAEKLRVEEEILEAERSEELRNKTIQEDHQCAELEREKAEKQTTKRNVDMDSQNQFQVNWEQDVCRDESKNSVHIQKFPHALQNAAETEAYDKPPKNFRHYVPLFSATFPWISQSSSVPINGGLPKDEQWVLNIQTALALGTSDLALSGYPQLERRQVTQHERIRMWSVLSATLCESFEWSNGAMQMHIASQMAERDKFLHMQPVFWVKFCDVLSIVSSDPQHQALHLHPLTTIEVAMYIPTGSEGSPPGPTDQPITLDRDELRARIQKRFSTACTKNLDVSPQPTNSKGSLSNHQSTSMPLPPPSGINDPSG